MTATEKQVAQILRDNITFSPQSNDYVIHGAIDKLLERERKTAIAFASWIALHGYRPAPTDTVLAGAWVMMKHRQDFTSDELYEKFKKEQQS